MSAENIKMTKDYALDNKGYDFQYVLSARPSSDSETAKAENAAMKSEGGARILCLVVDPTSSLVEIRLRNPLRRWASMFDGDVRILGMFEGDSADLSWADVVIFQREASEYVLDLAKRIQSHGKKVVFEIDDLLTQLPAFLSHHSKTIDPSLPFIDKILLTADAVSVSTNELASRFRSKNNNIYVTPNYSESITESAAHYEAVPSDVSLVVAASDKVFVDMLIEPLLNIQRELGVHVIAIGPPGERLAAAGIRVDKYSTVGHAEFKNFIASIDNGIGVIPLDSSEFSSCKTAVKYFDYSVSGIPSICSNVLPYSPVIENGVSGVLVENTTEAWTEALRSLITSHELRNRIVDSAKERVALLHNLDLSAQSWQLLVKSLNVFPRCAQVGHINMAEIRRDRSAIVRFAVRHVLKPDSYIKAFRALRRYGIRGLYERVVRR